MPCGVIGIYNLENVSYGLYTAGISLNHRGQSGVGIAVYDKNRPRPAEVRPGLVGEALSKDTLDRLRGKYGLMHLRYPTVKVSKSKNEKKRREIVVEHGAPVSITWPFYLSVVHNADMEPYIYRSRKSEIQSWGDIIESGSDAQIYMRYQTHFLREKKKITNKDIFGAASYLMESVPAAYSLVEMLAQGNGQSSDVKMIGITDPKRMRPLVLGKKKVGNDISYMFASETCALDTLGYKLERDVPGGTCIIVDKDGYHEKRLVETTPQYCMFEWAYFARPDSKISGIPVWKARHNLGYNLGKNETEKIDIVVPVLNSGMWNAIGYTKGYNANHKEQVDFMPALFKNEYILRTFIDDAQTRDLALFLKQHPIMEIIDGRKIALIDDSIVRGGTMKRLINSFWGSGDDDGASAVHVRIGTPPIIDQCHWAIDMKTHDQFLARGKTYEEIAKTINATSVKYNTIDDLVNAIGLPKDNLCIHCLSGRKPYPKKWGRKIT